MTGKRLRVLIAFPALLALAAGCALNPVTGRQEFTLVAPPEEVAIGARLYPAYTQSANGLFQDRDLQAYVAALGLEIAAASHRANLPWEFNVVNLSVPNAWSLPGGKVSVTRGMLDLLDREDQLAALLGHEIAHVAARHAAGALTRQTIAEAILGVGATSVHSNSRKTFGDLAGLASGLLLSVYSREEEREADRLGMEYISSAGWDPAGLVELLERLRSQEKGKPRLLESFFASHPLTSERLADARQRAARRPPGTRGGDGLFDRRLERLRLVRPAYEKAERGLALMNEDRFAEASEALIRAADFAPGEAVIHAWLAVAELGLGRPDAALREAAAAVGLYPGLFVARLAAAESAFELGEWSLSLEHAREADGLLPDRPQVLFLQGRAHEETGDVPRAAESFARLLKVSRGERNERTEYARRRLVEWGYPRR